MTSGRRVVASRTASSPSLAEPAISTPSMSPTSMVSPSRTTPKRDETTERVSERRLGILGRITFDDVPPARGLEPKRVEHLQFGITWDVTGILDRWAHPGRAEDTAGKAALIKWWLLKVSGPLPDRPGERGEFVMEVSFHGDRPAGGSPSARRLSAPPRRTPAADGDDGLGLLRRRAGDRDRPEGAACTGPPVAGAGMPDRPRQALAPAAAARRRRFSRHPAIANPAAMTETHR